MKRTNHETVRRSSRIEQSSRAERVWNVSQLHQIPVLERDQRWDARLGQAPSVPALLAFQEGWDTYRVSHLLVPAKNPVQHWKVT
jgi:hypothetical protein